MAGSSTRSEYRLDADCPCRRRSLVRSLPVTGEGLLEGRRQQKTLWDEVRIFNGGAPREYDNVSWRRL